MRSRGNSDPIFDEVKPLVEALLAKNYRNPADRESQDPEVIAVLQRLDKEIRAIREQANGYPDGAISMLVWMSGNGYANLCHKLTLHFRDAGWLIREENASALWASATLAVCSHYRHLVGPAMLANADCQQRLGNSDRAAQMYGAVVADFEMLLDWDHADGELSEDLRVAIESLQTALTRILRIGVSDDERERLQTLLARTNRILAAA